MMQQRKSTCNGGGGGLDGGGSHGGGRLTSSSSTTSSSITTTTITMTKRGNWSSSSNNNNNNKLLGKSSVVMRVVVTIPLLFAVIMMFYAVNTFYENQQLQLELVGDMNNKKNNNNKKKEEEKHGDYYEKKLFQKSSIARTITKNNKKGTTSATSSANAVVAPPKTSSSSSTVKNENSILNVVRKRREQEEQEPQEQQVSISNDSGKKKEKKTILARSVHGAGSSSSSEWVNSDDIKYHLIFSTGCSAFQDWQSYLFFFQLLQSGQPGNVTRIVSGCNDNDQQTLQSVFDEEIKPMDPERFHIHFTPDYSKIKPKTTPFVYFNKPFGTRHWLEEKMGYSTSKTHNPNDDVILILLDPDQAIMRPFTNNNFTNTEWKYIPDHVQPRTHIEHGKPMGQLYGFALQWKTKVNMTYVWPNELSPIDTMSNEEARAGYIVGPPYIATMKDMYSIVVKWTQFAVPVHDLYPHLLAEMFAYCLAAAHLKLAHQTAISFMVSDVGGGGEGWNYVDIMTPHDVCIQRQDVQQYPNVLHFCQRYAVKKYFWGKRRLPKDFISCHSPLLLEPPINVAVDAHYHIFPGDGKRKTVSERNIKRNAFMLCHLIRIANEAATYYKQHHCDPTITNYNKTYSYFEDMVD